MYRVDVIMATYNGQTYVREQIDSILKNQGNKVVLHIFDDGSSDDTMNILREYQNLNPNQVEVYQNERNLGLTLNFLTGIQQVMEMHQEATYFMCCDQDDVWASDKIEKTLKRMLQMERRYGEERPGLVFTDATITDEKLQLIEESFYKSQRYRVNKTEFSHLLMENLVIGCTTMINRAYEPFLNKLPAQARYHDWWLSLIAAAFGNISFLPRPTLNYRQHSGNVVGGARFGDYIANRVKNLRNQKASLEKNLVQAKEFYQIFEDSLSKNKINILQEFIQMFSSNWFKKRYMMLRYGFMKSGIARNLGLFLIL